MAFESSTTKNVQHNYRDYSRVAEINGDEAAKPRSDRNFPVKLHYMLGELEKEGLSHIIAWQPHGRCFLVHKQKEFTERVLPLWFHQTKFASFQRQLNLYGFNRITVGRDKNTYYHEYFLRGKRFLAHNIQRIRIKGNGARKPSSPKTEPNFYDMPYLPGTDAVNREARELQLVTPMPHIPSSEGAAALARSQANSRNDGGARLLESMFFDAHSMPIANSAMQAYAQSHMLPSQASPSPLSSLALSLAAERTHLPPGALPEALLRMSLALLPTPVLLPEKSSLARAVGLQSLASAYQANQFDHTLASIQDYILLGAQDPCLAALLLYGGGGHR